jgi:hypothetical protein
MAALRSSRPVVYALAPCETPGARVVMRETRPSRSQHDPDLHPRPEPRPARRPSPARPDARPMTACPSPRPSSGADQPTPWETERSDAAADLPRRDRARRAAHVSGNMVSSHQAGDLATPFRIMRPLMHLKPRQNGTRQLLIVALGTGQELLGHRDLATTMIYPRPQPWLGRRAQPCRPDGRGVERPLDRSPSPAC